MRQAGYEQPGLARWGYEAGSMLDLRAAAKTIGLIDELAVDPH